MPSDSRNLPEQEISIKSRAHEVFAKSEPAGPRRPTKPFPVYLRETPASPMSAAVKAGLWFTAIIVGLLFLAAVWKLTVRCGPGALRPTAGCASIKLHRQLPVGQPDSGFRGASNRAPDNARSILGPEHTSTGYACLRTAIDANGPQ